MIAEHAQLLQKAIEALRANHVLQAVELLRGLANLLRADEMPWEILARAEEGCGDCAAASSALDQRLLLDARDIGALLLKGRLCEKNGDSRAASSFYQTALAQEALTGGCPEPLRPLLMRAREAVAENANRFAEHLADTIRNVPVSGRIGQALDLLTGRTELFHQQPSMFYFPELPQRQFYHPEEFPWLAKIIEKTAEMRGELSIIEAEGSGFQPYVSRPTDRPAPNNDLLENAAWAAHWFWQDGGIVEDNAIRCPITMAALELAPMPVIRGRSPMALWSRLTPGTHIKPHHGALNTRLVCHIPVRLAPDCALRVGSDTREWVEGVPMVFDDSFEHEAWNRGNQSRTVLLFEIWRPEITLEEREALVEIFESIDKFSD